MLSLLLMKYDKYTIKTTVQAEDILSAELTELGVDGVEIDDNSIPDEIRGSEIFYDELPESVVPEGEALVSFYLAEGKDRSAVLHDVSALIERLRENIDMGDGGISVSSTADEDWINNWKEYFHQFEISFEDGKNALFIPSWENIPEEGKHDHVVHIDPGTAFGTGAHETTRLCIRALEKYAKDGLRFLDIGTGSGILALMLFLFGAAKGIGTDLDPGAVPAVRENFERNGLSDADFELILGNILDDKSVQDKVGKDYDLVVANILPDVLEPLTPMVPGLLRDGGMYIVSGVIAEKADMVKGFLENAGFSIVEKQQDGEWVCYVSLFHRVG